MRAGRLLALLVVAGIGAASPALAQPDPPPPPPPAPVPLGQTWVVITQDGSTYVGNLVENVVGSHVTIRLATGEVHRFDLVTVKRHGPGGRTDPVRVMPPPLPTAPASYTGPGAVQLRIRGDGTLFREGPRGWTLVCEVPCATSVDARGKYKIGGGELRDSSTFRMPEGQGHVELVSKGKSIYDSSGVTGAVLLLSLGPLPLLPGVFILTGMFDGSSPNGPPPDHTASQIAGGLLVATAAVMTALGVYLLIARPGSTVETPSGERVAKRKTPPKVRLTPQGLVF